MPRSAPSIRSMASALTVAAEGDGDRATHGRRSRGEPMKPLLDEIRHNPLLWLLGFAPAERDLP